MPKGPQGQPCSADALGDAFHIARIAPSSQQVTTFVQLSKHDYSSSSLKYRETITTGQDRDVIAVKAAAAGWN